MINHLNCLFNAQNQSQVPKEFLNCRFFCGIFSLISGVANVKFHLGWSMCATGLYACVSCRLRQRRTPNQYQYTHRIAFVSAICQKFLCLYFVSSPFGINHQNIHTLCKYLVSLFIFPSSFSVLMKIQLLKNLFVSIVAAKQRKCRRFDNTTIHTQTYLLSNAYARRRNFSDISNCIQN